MAEFTPGPWTSGRQDMMSIEAATDTAFKNIYAEDDRAPIHHVTQKRLGLVVAKAIDEDGVMNYDEIFANASLIAAAPDIYEALKAIMLMYGPVTLATEEIYDQACAALAKAEGKEPRNA